jgi:hypothetical protein
MPRKRHRRPRILVLLMPSVRRISSRSAGQPPYVGVWLSNAALARLLPEGRRLFAMSAMERGVMPRPRSVGRIAAGGCRSQSTAWQVVSAWRRAEGGRALMDGGSGGVATWRCREGERTCDDHVYVAVARRSGHGLGDAAPRPGYAHNAVHRRGKRRGACRQAVIARIFRLGSRGRAAIPS